MFVNNENCHTTSFYRPLCFKILYNVISSEKILCVSVSHESPKCLWVCQITSHFWPQIFLTQPLSILVSTCHLLALPQLMTPSDIFSVNWSANQSSGLNTPANHSSASSRLLRKQRIFSVESRSEHKNIFINQVLALSAYNLYDIDMYIDDSHCCTEDWRALRSSARTIPLLTMMEVSFKRTRA